VRPGIVVKEKNVFRVSSRTKSMDPMSQSVLSFLAPLMMCSDVEAGDCTTMVYGVLHNVGKSVLQMETLWKSSFKIEKMYESSK
jgi:hypothetical protein